MICSNAKISQDNLTRWNPLSGHVEDMTQPGRSVFHQEVQNHNNDLNKKIQVCVSPPALFNFEEQRRGFNRSS